MSVTEITMKLKNATPAQLKAILEILNTVEAPIVIAPKIRKANAWVVYLNQHKLDFPLESHVIAKANALKLYKELPVAPAAVVEKKGRKPKVTECAVCGFVPANKSNLNRHMKVKHTDKLEADSAIIKAGFNRETKRIATTRDPKVREESTLKLIEIEKLKEKFRKTSTFMENKGMIKIVGNNIIRLTGKKALNDDDDDDDKPKPKTKPKPETKET